MEIVQQTPGRLVVAHRNGRGMQLFAALCGLVAAGALVIFGVGLVQGIGRGSAVEIIICALMFLFMLLPAGLALNALLTEHVFDFDRDLDRFVIRERSLFGRTETAGRVSRIVSINHKIGYSDAGSDAVPESGIVVRYDDGAGSATRTATCGIGLVDEDRRLQRTLKAFLKL
jgi:hypothetical protein